MAGLAGDKLTSTYDLVEQMQYLYVRVVKAKELPGKDVTGSCDPYVEVKLGNYKGATRHFEKNTKPEWNQVFAFSKERIQSSIVEIVVKDKDFVKDDYIGRVIFDLNEVPKRVPPDSPLAPQWYRLEGRKGDKAKGELMLAVWMGTQGDEAFPEAWHSDAASVGGDAVGKIRSKVYLSPKLWVGPGKDETLGRCFIPLHTLQRRLDHKPVNTQWYNLEKHIIVNGEKKETIVEAEHWNSGARILSAHGLMPMKNKDGRGATDAYCVAKYGQKWVRTRTIIDSFHPRWNEQYTWEVFDPCTVITIGVFDNCHLHGNNGTRDSRIGKVRVRLSTLETDRVYTHSYPLIVLHPSGVKKMGEVQLAVRFSCSSWINMLHMYSHPLLPKMHYVHPLSVIQLDSLRHQATQIVSMRLSRAEPPLRKEVVEYMLDIDSHMWSMRRSKANFFRIMNVLSGMIAVGRWMRYDRLRSIAGRIQTVVGDLATQGERFQSLLSWRDPRATALFVTFCLVAAIVLYITPFKVVILIYGIYVLRHPRFRKKLPSVPINFFRRLPARTDSML
uniref:C2 domain-containing protein n=1 Tax=Chenopodium quinoa TaxID=63459 RepID=A0A803NC64_CHEQI